MKLNKILNNPFIVFLPFFFLYAAIAITEMAHINSGDSLRYQFYAKNLLSGYFSSAEIVDIWNGPMYPITLIPIFLFRLPIWVGLIFNAFFIYISGVFLYKSVSIFSSRKMAFTAAAIFMCMPNFHILTRALMSESLACAFASLSLYFSIVAFSKRKLWYTIVAGLMCAGLILTKVIFSYAFVVVGILFLLFSLWKKEALTGACIVFATFIFCSPWLIYTHAKTGKYFYWASSGGENLYLLALPYDDFKVDFMRCKNRIDFNWDWAVRQYIKNPKYETYYPDDVKNDAMIADKLSMVGSCDYLVKRSREFIFENPLTYCKNILLNIRHLFYAPPFARPSAIICFLCLFPIAVLSILAAMLALLNKVKIDAGVIFCISFTVVYLAGSILLIALWRQFYIIVPILIFWIFYIWNAMHKRNRGVSVHS